MKVATVVGTRPQFIKAAMVSRFLREKNSEILIHTGQHYDLNMSGIFFSRLDLPAPDYHFTAGAGSPGRQLDEILSDLAVVFAREKPSIVLVYGDSRSTLAGALAAAKAGIPLAHVEAGLRCHNPFMAEEFNRVLTDHLSSILFCPSEKAVRNLEAEGFTGVVKGGRLITMADLTEFPEGPCVVNVGDVLCDALLAQGKNGKGSLPSAGKKIGQPGEYLLATVHRAENTDHRERLTAILECLVSANERVVFPVHPRTAKKIQELGLSAYLRHPGLVLTKPVGYRKMIGLIKNAKRVITDSGGIQKEAFFLKIPCITLREETEWPETVDRGCNVLVGCDRRLFLEALAEKPNGDWSGFPYGKGDTSKLIARFLEGFCCRG